ncbi:MAG: tyrosine-type recombinase/integrase [Marinilabiliaceae bacterium]|nr:tyrosine-type recombinase/integrase [Marinilabiliaceae bacterium]MBN2819096.1 tyrosine-type recombinase/integrase [Bacteroidales bacterium]
MANVYFKVLTKATDQEKKVSIRIRFKHKTIDQSTATGQTVKLKYWDLTKQDFKKSDFPLKDKIKAELSRLKTHVEIKAIEVELIEQGWLVDVVDRYLHPDKYKQLEKRKAMFEWMEEYANNSPNAYRVVRSYHITINSLKKFNSSLEWGDVNLEFYDKNVQFLKNQNLAKNTIADRIKVIKALFNAALERKVHKNTDFKAKGFKKETEQSINVYLNEDELSNMFKYDLSNKPYLERVRDMFLIGCWTGCRFSDLPKIKLDNIEGDFITIEQQKTEKRVVIPLHPVVRIILNKYDGELPKMISNQKFNTYLKDVAKLSGIKGKISKSITKGGKRETDLIDKHEMVKSHTARRSFATNLYKSGLPSITIMAMTGHSTEKAFLSYIKVTEEEHAEIVMKHWRKQGRFLKVV